MIELDRGVGRAERGDGEEGEEEEEDLFFWKPDYNPRRPPAPPQQQQRQKDVSFAATEERDDPFQITTHQHNAS